MKCRTWRRLPFESSALGIGVAEIDDSIASDNVSSFSSDGIQLLYWSHRVKTTTSQETTTSRSRLCRLFLGTRGYFGYHVATQVRLERASNYYSNPADTLKSAAPDGYICTSIPGACNTGTMQKLELLAFKAGQHSPIDRDPALTRTQFECMYTARVRKFLSRQAADEVWAMRSSDGQVVGFATAKADGGSAAIGLLAVDEDHQRRGLGACLMHQVACWAAAKGLNMLSVRTQLENRGAVRFYQAQGFVAASTREAYHIWLPVDNVRFNVPYWTGRELDNIVSVIQSKALDSLGTHTKACEAWLCSTLKCGSALLTHSATAALEQAALLIGAGPGDEIIMPSFTFVSTASAFALRGATPVYVDVDVGSLNLDPGAVEQAITPKTKAIVVVHYAGVACDMDTIMDVAQRHGLRVIEDAAQALLSKHGDRHLGSIGHLACLSFHYTKNTMCGEGGALLVNVPDLVDRARIIREKGTNRSDFVDKKISKYEWVDLGSSYEPNELSAAFLHAQLGHAVECAAQRRRVCRAYACLLQPLEARGLLQLPKWCKAPATNGNGHMFWALLANQAERSRCERWMAARGVQCLSHYVPLHLTPAGKRLGRSHGRLAVTELCSSSLLRLPVWAGMAWVHVDHVVSSLCAFFNAPQPDAATSIKCMHHDWGDSHAAGVFDTSREALKDHSYVV